MPTKHIAEVAESVAAYLSTERGKRKKAELMYGRGYSYEKTVAEVVLWNLISCHNGQLREPPRYEDIEAITDEVMIATLGRAREPEAVA